MSDVEIAWVAGLLEGEGSFIRSKKTRGGGRDTISIRCSMTDRDVIDKLHKIVGGGNYNPDGYENKRKDDTRNIKRIYSWQMSKSSDVLELLHLIRRHMGDRRLAAIDDIIQYDRENPLKYASLRGEIIHGKRNTYEYHGCRCEDCRRASADRQKAQRLARKARLAQGCPV